MIVNKIRYHRGLRGDTISKIKVDIEITGKNNTTVTTIALTPGIYLSYKLLHKPTVY